MDWEKQHARLVALGDELAEAKAEYENYRNIKPTIIAQAMKNSGESTVNAQEREAHLSKDYINWCVESKVSMREYERLRLRYEAAKLWFEMQRTAAANRRAEMTLQ